MYYGRWIDRFPTGSWQESGGDQAHVLPSRFRQDPGREEAPRAKLTGSLDGVAEDGEPEWLRQLRADEETQRATAWLKQFKGDLRALDVLRLWRSAGLNMDQKDDEKFTVQCPNRASHSDPEAFGGTVLYKRPVGYPFFHCGRTKCRDGRFGTREALLSFGPELVDQF